ncbi:amidohydrolase [Olsenella profusa]|uniref:Amidohydrolase n=1 Tax=Olsenella profusa TaxID=138595 RepID=A0ABS2F2Y2_9ACTN|nr:amidohydrolase [Olsenella profusa]MBM6775351.1 amidohydrolase [Olsenella profusa]
MKRTQSAPVLVRGGLVHDAVHRKPYVADVLLADGKIAAIGEGLDAPEGGEVVDAAGLEVYPGFVDAHTHIGLDGSGIGYEGRDYNEMNDICSPQLRGIDGVNPRDPSFAAARTAGVTCVCTGPGSANVLGGTFVALKTVGERVDDMVVRDPVAMKCAFGENPKRVYREKCDSTRMSTAAILRGALAAARDYGERKRAAAGDASKLPAYNQKWEALLPVLDGTIPLKAHAHQANDIFTALRIAHEFGVRITLEHVTEGHLIADELAAEEGVPMAVGPTLTHASKFELQNKSWSTPGVLDRAGCHVSIITDNSVIPQQYLPLCAGMAVKAGMDPFSALRAITINPAEHIGVAERVGSLEVGKDADLVICDGSPFEVMTEVRAVFIDGVRVAEA